MLDEIFRLRIKSEEKEKIRETAKALNMNMSKFVLKCVMEKIKEMEETNGK